MGGRGGGVGGWGGAREGGKYCRKKCVGMGSRGGWVGRKNRDSNWRGVLVCAGGDSIVL